MHSWQSQVLNLEISGNKNNAAMSLRFIRGYMSKLENRDYVVLLDRSGSMGLRDTKSGRSRWQEGQELIQSLADKVSAYDADGITVIPFNDSHKVYSNVSATTVAQIFNEVDPMGGTTMAPVLAKVFSDYTARKAKGDTKANGEYLIVLTDGAPSDESAVAKKIVEFGNKLDNGDSEYNILVIQVGSDSGATHFLRKLDDELTSQGAKHDIVDCKTSEEVGQWDSIAALLEHSLND
jgi:uncharacterized protein YegL